MVQNQNTHSPQNPLPRHWHSATLWVKCFVGILVCISIAQAAANSIIWERGDQIVQLAQQDDASAPPNDHPITTTRDEIAAMLRILRLRYADEDTDVAPASVFTKEEIDNLGKAIATGLGRAAPSQDVVFHVIGARRLSPGAFAKRNRVSAGRVFYRGGEFNIIFGQVQTPYRKRNVYGQRDQDFYPRNYGSRTKATNHDVVLLSNDAVSLIRNDWFVIEPGFAVATANAEAQPTTSIKPVTTPPPASSAAAVALAETPATPSSPAASSSSDTATEVTGETSAQSTRLTADVEERLEALKRLRDRELISEEAYQAKMKEILQDL